MRLLVTRPEPDATCLANQLRELGHDPILQPLFQFKPLPFNMARFTEAGSLLISSGNALRALSAVDGMPDILRLPVFCVGKQTAHKASAFGFIDIVAVAQTGAALAERIVDRIEPRHLPVLHVTGEHQAFDFQSYFANHRIPFYTLSVYQMQAADSFDARLLHCFKTKFIDGVIILSPRTAEVYVDLCQKHCLTNIAEKIQYYCLSEAVALMLNKLEPETVWTATNPSLEAVFMLLTERASALINPE